MAGSIAEFVTPLNPRKLKTSELIDVVFYLKGLTSTHESDKAVLLEKIKEVEAEIDRRVPIP